MSESTAFAWAPITKSEKQEDGTVIVYGPAATSALDRDQQRLDQGWLDQAMPEWMAEGGNVREQHDARRAVGVGVGLSKGDDGAHYIAAHIVDPVAVKKVETGVLKGFSVGIKAPQIQMGKVDAPKGLVTGGSIIEVSVVDRPANPGCLFELAKADAAGDLAAVEDAQVVEKTDHTFGLSRDVYDQLATPVKEALAGLAALAGTVTAEAVKADTADEAASVVVNVHVQPPAPEAMKADLPTAGQKKAAASGAMKDGSHPINTKADLRKAIKAASSGGADQDPVRRHISKRAKALGLEDMVPSNWNGDGSLNKADDTAENTREEPAAVDPMVEKAEALLRDVRGLVPELAKADAPAGGEVGNEGGDIDGAQQAIACIAGLIVAEAESLAAGNLNEAADISILLDAVDALKWFVRREQAENQGDDTMMFADTADLAKADKPQPAATEPATTQTQDFITKADVAELIKSAVAEATTVSKERTEALEAELAKAQTAIGEFRAMPQPGGPVMTRTAAQEQTARQGDAEALRVQARTYLAKADQVTDRDLREGYREKAAQLMAKAEA